ncbi:MAG: ParB/RepB/Spo0J family partition protein [Sulfurimonas sp.]|nr:ParB/RepB/Spo0J family partition protein [Sulfurimonas sp.]
MNLSKINKATAGKTNTTGISSFMELELSKVYPNPAQPRKQFSEDEITELCLSIQQDGLLQPIVVVKRDAGYMIVSGERRYRAHVKGKFLTIQANIIRVDDDKVLELALIENIQREDLTDFEVAVHIGKLWASGNYNTKGYLSLTLGKSPSYVSKAFSCLKLDSEIIHDLEENKHNISISVLDEISRVTHFQKKVYDKYIAGEITRDDIKSFRTTKKDGFRDIREGKQKIVCYGFGTQNQLGSFIAINKGGLHGSLKVEINGEQIKHSNDANYKITIEEV